MIALGSNEISQVYVGNSKIDKIYLGGDLMWEEALDLGYIQRGLVFHLDGEDYNDGTWVAKKGGAEYVVDQAVTIDSSGGVVLNNSLLIGDTKIDVLYNVGTIEVVYKSNRTSGWDTVFYQGTGGYFCYMVTSGRVSWHAGKSMATKVVGDISKTYTHSISSSHNYFNKVSMGTGTNASWQNSSINPSLIGKYTASSGAPDTSSTYNANGTLYQIRIYNRILSEAEILHNAQLDVERYNITI